MYANGMVVNTLTLTPPTFMAVHSCLSFFAMQFHVCERKWSYRLRNPNLALALVAGAARPPAALYIILRGAVYAKCAILIASV